ncbi:MAG: thioredoxin domain-containing protein [Roseibium sp.]|uniref:DsbA family protein n=1 Tax=Roseibium sp. TaxID=1936156 RepID=UPI001B131243|nr:DsbA family protein [Roseibium sp.]MBO6510469.1 thioredoxin domain-containing protein [Roseibium sp.]MBO6895591.1 thioredoxin domain-containing protein [Roseibium sp.]MBO6929541.1 thioredoxin domain-containing protein [Roseibium sp.]
MTRILIVAKGLCPEVLVRILSVCALLISLSAASATAQDLDRGEIEKIVREYLLENPEIIAEALTELDRRERAAEEAARLQALNDSADILFNSTRQVVLGNPEGSITLVEFFDYNCGFCKRAYGDMVKLIDENPDLRVVLKEFPVLGQASVEAAQVAIAVNSVAPEKYAEFHETLLMSRGQANQASALAAATAAGIDEADLTAALGTDEAGQTIEEVYTLANRLGLTGTPSYVIGNEVVMGAVGHDQLREKIEAAKNCEQTTC